MFWAFGKILKYDNDKILFFHDSQFSAILNMLGELHIKKLVFIQIIIFILSMVIIIYVYYFVRRCSPKSR